MNKSFFQILVVIGMVVAISVAVFASGQIEGYEALEHNSLERNESSVDSSETGEKAEESVEHSRDEGGEGENEESGTTYALDETYNFTRKGTRLIINYNRDNNEFIGTVENITEMILESVRVEIHLSNGIEIGPTTPVDLKPGEKISLKMSGTKDPFNGWIPHAEVGRSEPDGTENGESAESNHNESGEEEID